jgi:hypothetical protein
MIQSKNHLLFSMDKWTNVKYQTKLRVLNDIFCNKYLEIKTLLTFSDITINVHDH